MRQTGEKRAQVVLKYTATLFWLADRTRETILSMRMNAYIPPRQEFSLSGGKLGYNTAN